MRLRGVLIGVFALAAVALAASGALAQPRGNSAQRGAPPLPPTGHQTEPVDLNEGKSAAELFQAGCAVCHQSAAGLAKGRKDSELTGFLRQHYTSSVQHAAALASFLSSGGRGGPAVAVPARQAPIDRPPAPIGRRTPDDERKEAARPQDQREAPGKRKPQDRPATTAVRTPPAAVPAAAPEPPAPAETGTSASSPPPEEKPAAPEIPL